MSWQIPGICSLRCFSYAKLPTNEGFTSERIWNFYNNLIQPVRLETKNDSGLHHYRRVVWNIFWVTSQCDYNLLIASCY